MGWSEPCVSCDERKKGKRTCALAAHKRELIKKELSPYGFQNTNSTLLYNNDNEEANNIFQKEPTDTLRVFEAHFYAARAVVSS